MIRPGVCSWLLWALLLQNCQPTANDPQAPTRLEILAPRRVWPGGVVPLRVLALVGDLPAIHHTATYSLSVGSGTVEPSTLRVTRGVGGATVRIAAEGQVALEVRGAGLSVVHLFEVMAVSDTLEVSGTLAGDDLTWKTAGSVHVLAGTRVPAGGTLRIEAGVRVLLAEKTNLLVEGELVCEGTADDPVVFAPLNPNQPWGGIVHQSSPGQYRYALLVGGGADASQAFGHSGSQPVLFVAEGRLLLSDVVIMDCPGKAAGGRDARVELERVLVSRCDTGGEFERSQLTARSCHFLEIPSADSVPADDDNDGIYLLDSLAGDDGEPLPSTISDCVFAGGKDDGIDHNGTTLEVRGCRIEDFANEGIACSSGGEVRIVDTLVANCTQGIEAGYGTPHVSVDHCTVVDNAVGFRVGDSYDWETNAHLMVRDSIAAFNSTDNVLNFVNLLGGPLPGAIDISTSLVDDPEWNDRDGNLSGQPIFDDQFLLQDGSPGQAGASDGSDMGLYP